MSQLEADNLLIDAWEIPLEHDVLDFDCLEDLLNDQDLQKELDLQTLTDSRSEL